MMICKTDLVLGDEGGSIGPVMVSVSKGEWGNRLSTVRTHKEMHICAVAGSEESVRSVQWWGFRKYALVQ